MPKGKRIQTPDEAFNALQRKREYMKLYMARYDQEHPNRREESKTRVAVKHLENLGYTVTPPKGSVTL